MEAKCGQPVALEEVVKRFEEGENLSSYDVSRLFRNLHLLSDEAQNRLKKVEKVAPNYREVIAAIEGMG
jgi:inorganic triphosphatase YgiF